MRPNQSQDAGLIAAWRARADDLEPYSAGAAAAFRRCAQELEEQFRTTAFEELTLTEAAELSGYSMDHLARLVRQGRIANAGRPNAPRIRRADLPLKPAALRPTGAEGHAVSRRRIALAVAHSDSER